MQTNLNIQTKKINLIQWLSTIKDESLLNKVSTLISSETKKNWWPNTSKNEKASVEKGIENADSGKLNPHSKAKDIYGKWL